MLLFSISHHGEEAERVESSRCTERQRFIPEVLQFLLSFMKHLHTFSILILQLPQLQK